MATEMGIAKTTAHRWLHLGLDLLISLKHAFVRWPTVEECRRSASQFESYAKIKGVIGSVDCSHIAVRVRDKERTAYNCRKMFYSIHLLAVVDAADRFLYIRIGDSGADADARVLRYSGMLREQFQCVMHGQDPPIPYGYFIIADGGFMALPWVVSNYQGVDLRFKEARRFNNAVAATRHGVERAYGQLKARFKILSGRQSFNSIEQVSRMVWAAVVLHNANLDFESTHEALVRGPATVSDGEPCANVIEQQRQFAEVLQAEAAQSDLDLMAWPERLTRSAGKAVRRSVALDTLGLATSLNL